MRFVDAVHLILAVASLGQDSVVDDEFFFMLPALIFCHHPFQFSYLTAGDRMELPHRGSGLLVTLRMLAVVCHPEQLLAGLRIGLSLRDVLDVSYLVAAVYHLLVQPRVSRERRVVALYGCV